jgi:sec-independent protein translocase protein TatB
MFNLGFMEMVVVGVLALIFIGPKQLPEIARVLGRMIKEFKSATSELSGGLLDIKNDLREPFEDGMQAVNKIRSDIVAHAENAINSVNETEKLDLHSSEQAKSKEAFNPPHTPDDKDSNDPEKV